MCGWQVLKYPCKPGWKSRHIYNRKSLSMYIVIACRVGMDEEKENKKPTGNREDCECKCRQNRMKTKTKKKRGEYLGSLSGVDTDRGLL